MLINKYQYIPLTRSTLNGKRVYVTPDGEKLPSVTTILDKTKPEESKIALAKWKQSVGEKRAQEITTEAASRGTRVHTYLENFIKTSEFSDYPTNPYAQESWRMAAEIVLKGVQENVDEVWGVEVPLYFKGLYAGTTDCVGVWNGNPAIMDFKQSNKPKKKEFISDYFLQVAAYAQAHNNMFNTNIRTGVILMAVRPKILPDGCIQNPEYLEFIIEGEEFDFWSNEWTSRVEMYYRNAINT